MSTTFESAPQAGGEAGKQPTPSRRRWFVLGMIMLLMVINFADKTVYGLAGKSLMADLGLTQSQFGLGGSIFFLLFGVTAVLVGFLGNRVGSTKVLLVLAIAWSVSLMPVLLAPAVGTLLLSRLLLGAAEGPTYPVAVHGVHKWFPESKRAMPTAMLPVAAGLGVAISAPLLTGVIASHGWQIAFWILAILGPVWAIGWLLIGREGPFSTYASASDLAESNATAGDEVKLPYRKVFGSSGWWGPLLACAPAYISFVVFSVWAPVYFEDGLGLSTQKAGTMVGLFAVVVIIGTLFSSALSGFLVHRGVKTRLSRSTLTGAVVVVSGVLMVGGLLVDGAGLKLVLLIIGFGLANTTNAVGMLSVSEVSPVGQRSAIMALWQSVVTVGGALASLAVGIVADRSLDAGSTAVAGYEKAFMFLAVLAIVGGIATILFTDAHRDAIRLGLQKATGKEAAPAA